MTINEKALSAFIAKKAEVEDLLEQLQTVVGDHLDATPEEINWGYVGSMAHILEELKEINEFIAS